MSFLQIGCIFSDGMVIQRDKETLIWGNAPSEKTVQIRFAGKEFSAKAMDGKWKTKLPAVPAGGSYNLTICCEGEQISIEDILAGEVWIAGGQSNMEWPLKAAVGGREEAAAANFNQIRHFNVQKVTFPGETEEIPEKFTYASKWRSAVDNNATEFSAVAFHFAKELYEKLGVPVGIVECNLGGSSAAAWMREEYLRKDRDTCSYLEDYEEAVARLDLKEYIQKCTAGAKMLLQSPPPMTEVENTKVFDLSDLPEPLRETLSYMIKPGPRHVSGSPTRLYDTMLSTIIPYTCTGVIYYQGETDDVKGRIYGKLFRLLIENWRKDFENEDLYFLFVQLAAYNREGYAEGELYPVLREQQKLVADTVPNTGMAVAMDMGSEFDIHPRRKAQIGQRLALLAREKVYRHGLDASGPVFSGMELEEGRIILHFEHTANGLFMKGDQLKGFQISGGNRKFFDAKAELSGNTVIVSSPEVKLPEAASYGWANYMEVNLYNSEGLPAVPFRTDKFL